MEKIKSKLSIVLSAALIASAALGLAPEPRAEAAGYGIGNPTVNQSRVVTWDSIYFGNYWQEDTNGDKKADENDAKKPIQWRVLSVNGDDAFIMAEKCLDYQKYNEENAEITWETCTLRKWLNETFYNNAFSTAEQAAIKTTTVLHDNDPYRGTHGGKDTQDKVYLPSLKEVVTAEYGFDTTATSESNTRHASTTEYVAATKKVIVSNPAAPFSWWTRTPGRNLRYARVIEEGAAGDSLNQGGFVCYAGKGVRPVLHINLSVSSVWKKAGTVQQKSKLTATSKTSTTKTTVTTKKSGSAMTATKVKVPKVRFKVKSNKLTVKYTAPKNAAGFQIRYKLGKGKWKVRTYMIKRSVSKTISGLKKGKYKVQARSFTTGRKTYSKWSKAKTIRIKKAKKKTKKKVQLDMSEG